MKKENLKKGIQKKSVVAKGKQPHEKRITKQTADLLGLGIIILLGIIIYSNSFSCSFHFDDNPNIVENPAIQNLNHVSVWWNFVPSRPIGSLTFALNYHFNKLNVGYYHFVNLLIHLINACLVGWFTLLIFSSPSIKGYRINEHKKYIALFAALLFVSHPLATQSVTYIVQRLASLVAMFYLFSVVFYMKARLSDKGARSKYLFFFGCLFSGLLAFMTKENAYTLPFAIIMIEIFFFRNKIKSVNFRDYRLYLIIAGLTALIIFMLTKFSFSIFDPIPPEQGHTYTVTSQNYLLTQFSVIVKYIQLLILPVHQNLDYDYPISNSFFEIRTWLSFIFLLGLLILAVFLFKKHRVLSFGIFWFFLTLAVEASFIPIPNLIFEHRTYLPSVGFFLILSAVIYILLWNKYKFLAISIFVIIIGSNSILTYERNKVWQDDFTLWNDVVSKSPNKARPYLNRGLVYESRGQLDLAIADYSKAIRFNPDLANAWYNRGVVYRNLGEYDNALADLSMAIKINPQYYEAYYNCGFIYGNLKKWDQAITNYTKAIEMEPKNSDLYNNRGTAYNSLERWDKAIEDFSRAIEINPKFVMAYTNRGFAYSKTEQWEKAIADNSRALEISPDNTVAYAQREQAIQNLQSKNK
jgi:protein O-mannosyl-transferase